MRKQIERSLGRGSVQVPVRFQSTDQLGLDVSQVVSTYQQLNDLAVQAGAPYLDQALRYCQQQSSGLPEEISQLAQVCDQALAACREMRMQEGAVLTEAMQTAALELRQVRNYLSQSAEGRSAQHLTRLEQRLQELLVQLGQDEIDQQTLARELAVYADRVDVTEELVRLDSHLDQLDTLLADQGHVGKKIEFLLQEIGREINTTGSKANDAELQGHVIAGKHLLDQLKEQAANCC